MVKVKKASSKPTAVVKPSADETYVVPPLKDDDEETKNKSSEDEDEREGNEEENDSEDSEDDVPAKRIKLAPKKAQRKAKEKEEKAPANLAKVLKSKGKNNKVGAAVAKTSNNSDPQSSKPSTAKQKMLDVILSGLSTMDTKKGVSFPALKKYILEEDGASNAVNWERVRPKIKAALEQGIQDELILRPKGSENVTGLQGSFKLNKAKYTSKKSSAEKQTAKTKDSAPAKTTAQVSKSESSKRPLKTKSKEVECPPKKKVGNVRRRRSVSEDIRMSEWRPKKLKKSRSMEEISGEPEEPKKKLKKVKKRTTPKKK